MPNPGPKPRTPDGVQPPSPPAPSPLSRRALPEPPGFRAHPAPGSGACVNCGGSVGSGHAVPSCWECGRPLCVDCYWRHGLTPTDHRCAGCSVRQGRARLTVSGGRVAAPDR